MTLFCLVDALERSQTQTRGFGSCRDKIQFNCYWILCILVAMVSFSGVCILQSMWFFYGRGHKLFVRHSITPNAAPAELPWVQPGVIAARFAGWKMWGRLAGGSQPNSTKNHDRDFTTLWSFRVNLRRQEEGNWWLGQGLLYWSAL